MQPPPFPGNTGARDVLEALRSELPLGLSELPNWHGSEDELARLTKAIEDNCVCTSEMYASGNPSCGPHEMLRDERILDHLVYGYRARARFIDAEWTEVGGALGAVSSDW